MIRETRQSAKSNRGPDGESRFIRAVRIGALGAVLAIAALIAGTATGVGPVGPSAAQAQSDEDEDDSEAPAPEGLDAEEIAERIQKYYKETKDFQAEFTQVYTDVAAGEKKTNWGKVYFKKPGKMRWDYYESEELGERKKTLVSDGELFWVYELEFKQVFKQCLEDSQLPTSLKFLMGEGNLVEDFDIEFSDASTASAPELILEPKKPTPKYKKVHFRVDPERYRVAKTTVFDPYGNTNEINFGEPRLNQNLPDSGFAFEPPEGARLLNPEKDCE